MANADPQGSKEYPDDVLVIKSILKNMGIKKYEPRAVTQLLEFANRYVVSVLGDAKAFSSHAQKKFIDVDDVKLAVMMQMDRAPTTAPPRDLMLEVARGRNNTPLPEIKAATGLRLPPERYCFDKRNYKYEFLRAKKVNRPSK